MPSFDLRAHLETLWRIIHKANENLAAWWVLEGAENMKLYCNAENEFPGYFMLAIQAHEACMILNAVKIFDGRADVVSLLSTYKLALATGKLTQGTMDYYESGLAEHEKTIVGLKLIRHKNAAHTDNELTVKEIYKAAGITPNNLRAVLVYAAHASNYIANDLFREKHALNGIAENDLRKLLDHINETLVAHNEIHLDESIFLRGDFMEHVEPGRG